MPSSASKTLARISSAYSVVGGLSGQHFLKQLMHHEASFGAAADRARDASIVQSRGKLFGERRGVGGDLVTFCRRRQAVWHLVAAWAAPYDGAAGRGNGGGFATPGRFVLGIFRLRNNREDRGRTRSPGGQTMVDRQA